MSFNGDLWSSLNRIASVAKMNLKGVLVGTGDQILGKSAGSLQQGMVSSVTTTSTGGALKGPGLYMWTGSAWETPQGTAHLHSSTADGGTFQNVLLKAIQNTWYVNKVGVTQYEFKTSGTGGTYSDVISGTDRYTQINSGAASTNSGNLRYGGINYTFAQPSSFVVRILLASTTTSSTARCGMNVENAEAVTDNKPKYAFEGCSTCNSTNMSIISADGTTRSKDVTSTDNYATIGNFIMSHNAGSPFVKYRKEAGTIITKTNNVPGTLASVTPDRSNAWQCGIQTNTTAARTLNLYGFQAVGTIGDTIPVLP